MKEEKTMAIDWTPPTNTVTIALGIARKRVARHRTRRSGDTVLDAR